MRHLATRRIENSVEVVYILGIVVPTEDSAIQSVVVDMHLKVE